MKFRFVGKRLLGAFPLLLGVSIVLFGVIHLAPGGPLDIYADNPSVTPETLEQIKESYGLDQPLPVQYLSWLKAMLTGDWGYSIRTGRPVLTEIWERLPNTLLLSGVAMALAFLVALPLGIISAVKRHSFIDHFMTFFSFAGISIPVFWLALIFQLLFSISLGWLPSSGLYSFGDGSFLDRLSHLVMPATILSLTTIASWGRYMRSGMIDVLGQDYIRTAYAKGQSQFGVIIHHALRNALLPVITVIALDMATIITGAIIIETVFAWPGIGRLFMDSMESRDYPVLMGLMMAGALAIVLANIIADIAYAIIDPRIKA